MDPINPITPGPPPISARLPVQPLQRISREHDRPSNEQQGRKRRPPREQPDAEVEKRDDDGRPHVDVRA
jgi:hypothetical protein